MSEFPPLSVKLSDYGMKNTGCKRLVVDYGNNQSVREGPAATMEKEFERLTDLIERSYFR